MGWGVLNCAERLMEYFYLAYISLAQESFSESPSPNASSSGSLVTNSYLLVGPVHLFNRVTTVTSSDSWCPFPISPLLCSVLCPRPDTAPGMSMLNKYLLNELSSAWGWVPSSHPWASRKGFSSPFPQGLHLPTEQGRSCVHGFTCPLSPH